MHEIPIASKILPHRFSEINIYRFYQSPSELINL